MEYYRVMWGDNSGSFYVTDFSNQHTAFRFRDYVDSLDWWVGGFATIEI